MLTSPPGDIKTELTVEENTFNVGGGAGGDDSTMFLGPKLMIPRSGKRRISDYNTGSYQFRFGKDMCKLRCQRCAAESYKKDEKTGQSIGQCLNKVCVGLPYCHYHMKMIMGLRLANPEKMSAGVYAFTPFPIDKPIWEEKFGFGSSELKFNYTKYGTYGPYQIVENRDGACQRSLSTMFTRSMDDKEVNCKVVGTAPGKRVIMPTRNIAVNEKLVLRGAPLVSGDYETFWAKRSAPEIHYYNKHDPNYLNGTDSKGRRLVRPRG